MSCVMCHLVQLMLLLLSIWLSQVHILRMVVKLSQK